MSPIDCPSSAFVITGIGKRIGFATCQYLLSKGHAVIGSYRTSYPELDTLRAQGATLIKCDFYQQSSIENFITTVKQQPALRGIIHNASDWMNDINTNSASVFNTMMQIHASVPYQINLALHGLLEENSDIIHITDYVAEKGSKKHIAYAASKAALANMTLSFSALLAPKVKVNSIAPALIKFNQDDDSNYRSKALTKSLIPREGGYQEIFNALDYLINSHYVTGRTLSIDGGRHLK